MDYSINIIWHLTVPSASEFGSDLNSNNISGGTVLHFTHQFCTSLAHQWLLWRKMCRHVAMQEATLHLFMSVIYVGRMALLP
jgi:hypothetical protein